MITRKTVRSIVQLVNLIGTSQIVAGVINHNTAPRTVTEKVAIRVGAVAVGAAVSEKTQPAMDKVLDGTFELYDSVKTALNKK